jgi:integrase
MLKDFLSLREQRSPKTASIYGFAIRQWAKANDSKPDEIVASIKQGQIDPYDCLTEYVKVLNGKSAPKTIRTFVGGVRQFLGFERIEVNSVIFRSVVGQFLPKNQTVSTHRAPTYAEARQLMLTVKPPIRVAISLMLGSGLRIGEVVPLCVENFDLDEDHPSVTINPTDTKGGTQRTVPLTRECRGLIVDFLGDRVKDRKAFLFPVEGERNNDKLSLNIYRMIMYGLEQIGLHEKVGKSKRYLVHPHMFRRFFFTCCIGAGVDRGLAEFWMGHKFALDESYLESTKLIEHFRKVEPKLTFLGIPLSDDIQETVETQSVEMRAQTVRIKQLEEQYTYMMQCLKHQRIDLLYELAHEDAEDEEKKE